MTRAWLLLAACGGGDASFGDPVRVGPDDSLLVPSSNVACSDGFPVQINPSFPQPFTGQGAASCTVVTFSNVQPTALGKIVAATIGVGPTTGPMRFVRLRVLAEQSTGTACCSAEETGDTFTPAANGLTTVPLDFLMDRGADEETGIEFNDWIGIEVLAPTVPVPGVWTNNGGADPSLPAFEWLPALGARPLGQNLHSDGSYSGFVPTFSVSFAPAL